jgi:tRNA (mo5U34)-methyltransferase
MVDINKIKRENLNDLDFSSKLEKIESIGNIKDIDIAIEDTIKINSNSITNKQSEDILDIAKALKPWRKGPFLLFDNFIDTEWLSYKKYNFFKKHLFIKNKIVADVGCNNGYYMFRLLEQNPKKLVGFDPSKKFFLQFLLLDKFIKSGIDFEILGIENLSDYKTIFDVVLCFGVLYHRSDPVGSLKSLRNSLKRDGELFLDTLVLDRDDEYALFPSKSYQKMTNLFFIPTIKTLKNWLLRAGFVDIEILGMIETTTKEQRRTDWIVGESLEDFLDPNNSKLTIEGYPAPLRAYVKCRRK